jgi:hypothetical protein
MLRHTFRKPSLNPVAPTSIRPNASLIEPTMVSPTALMRGATSDSQ